MLCRARPGPYVGRIASRVGSGAASRQRDVNANVDHRCSRRRTGEVLMVSSRQWLGRGLRTAEDPARRSAIHSVRARPRRASPKVAVLINHGYGEYGYRYRPAVERWIEQGILVAAYDLRGHGSRKESADSSIGSPTMSTTPCSYSTRSRRRGVGTPRSPGAVRPQHRRIGGHPCGRFRPPTGSQRSPSPRPSSACRCRCLR